MSTLLPEGDERRIFEEAAERADHSPADREQGAPVPELSPRVVALLERMTHVREDWDLIALSLNGQCSGRVRVRGGRISPIIDFRGALYADPQLYEDLQSLGEDGDQSASYEDRLLDALGHPELRPALAACVVRALAALSAEHEFIVEPTITATDEHAALEHRRARRDKLLSPQEVYIAERVARADDAMRRKRALMRGMPGDLNCALIDPHDRPLLHQRVLWADPYTLKHPELLEAWTRLYDIVCHEFGANFENATSESCSGIMLRNGIFAAGIGRIGTFGAVIVGAAPYMGRIASVIYSTTRK